MPRNKLNENESLVSQLKELDKKLDASSKSAPDAGALEANNQSDQAKETVQETITNQPEVAVEQTDKPESSKAEQAFEQYKGVNDEHPEESPYVIKQAKSARDDDIVQSKPQQVTDIEDIMTEDLSDLYQAMTPEEQAKFKAKGEEVAEEINSLMGKAKLTAKKVLQLIRNWLKLLPGVNKYFLEQEAKIKTEELIHYARERNKPS